MAKKIKATEVLSEARTMADIWKENPTFTLENMNLEDYVNFFTTADTLDKAISQKETELAGLKASHEDQLRKLDSLVIRFRTGMRAFFGPDSKQYEQAGGTRTSNRKSATRKTTTTTGTTSNPAA